MIYEIILAQSHTNDIRYPSSTNQSGSDSVRYQGTSKRHFIGMKTFYLNRCGSVESFATKNKIVCRTTF
jgi:hypothetical protein